MWHEAIKLAAFFDSHDVRMCPRAAQLMLIVKAQLKRKSADQNPKCGPQRFMLTAFSTCDKLCGHIICGVRCWCALAACATDPYIRRRSPCSH